MMRRFGGDARTTPIGPGVRNRVARSLKHVILVFFAVTIIVPLLWVVFLSVNSLPDAYNNWIWPRHGFDFNHYTQAWQGIPTLPRHMWNSLHVTVLTVVLTVIASTLGGYALVHLRLPGRAVVLAVLVGSLFFPTQVTGLIGVWEIQRQLGILNTTWGLIPPYVTLRLALGIFVMRAVFQTISSELMQAATVDGAGPWQAFRHVMAPLAINGMIVVSLITFITAWGEYVFAATLTWERTMRTLPVQLVTVTGGIAEWSWPRIAAVYVMAVLPAFVLFALVSRRFMDTLQEGALKG
jgi:ABC-type glycerol-3-phosphate transport system permease component